MSLSCTIDQDIDAGENTVFWIPSLYTDYNNDGYRHRHCDGCKTRLGDERVYAVPHLRFPFADDRGWGENQDQYDIKFWTGFDLLKEIEEEELNIGKEDINGDRIWPQKDYYHFGYDCPWPELENQTIPQEDREYFAWHNNQVLGLLTDPPEWTTLCKKCMHVQWALEDMEFCNVPLDRHKAIAEYREYCDADRKHKKQLREERVRTRLAGMCASLKRIKGNGEYYFCWGDGKVVTPRTVRSLYEGQIY